MSNRSLIVSRGELAHFAGRTVLPVRNHWRSAYRNRSSAHLKLPGRLAGQRFPGLAHDGSVALFTGPPGATRQVASILWWGKVTPPPPRSRLTQVYRSGLTLTAWPA